MPKIVDHEQRKAEITQVVLKSIAKNGLANTTIRGVARAGGFSSGTLAHYFNDKDDLINFAFAEVASNAHKRIEEKAQRCSSAFEKLKVVISELTPSPEGDTDSRISLAFWAAVGHDDRLVRKFHEVYDALRAYIRTFVREGVKAGEFAASGDLEEDVDLIVAITDGLLISVLLDPQRFDVARRGKLIDASLTRFLASQ